MADTSATALADNEFRTGIDNYGAFAGTQITAHINHVQIGTLMGLSYTVHTEKQGQYTMGSQNVRRFVTGKRGIAGTLIFNTFDRSALLAIFGGSNFSNSPLLTNDPFLSAYGSASSLRGTNTVPTSQNDIWSKNAAGIYGAGNSAASSVITDVQDAYANTFNVPMDYADQLPPFNVNLAMVDTQGAAAAMSVIGVEIMNEGGGFTVDDLTNQTAYTFVAKAIRPLVPIGRNNQFADILPKTEGSLS